MSKSILKTLLNKTLITKHNIFYFFPLSKNPSISLSSLNICPKFFPIDQVVPCNEPLGVISGSLWRRIVFHTWYRRMVFHRCVSERVSLSLPSLETLYHSTYKLSQCLNPNLQIKPSMKLKWFKTVYESHLIPKCLTEINLIQKSAWNSPVPKQCMKLTCSKTVYESHLIQNSVWKSPDSKQCMKVTWFKTVYETHLFQNSVWNSPVPKQCMKVTCSKTVHETHLFQNSVWKSANSKQCMKLTCSKTVHETHLIQNSVWNSPVPKQCMKVT